MYAIPRRIENDQIWHFFNLIEDFKYITGYKLAVMDVVSQCILPGCHNRLFYDLHADDLF